MGDLKSCRVIFKKMLIFLSKDPNLFRKRY